MDKTLQQCKDEVAQKYGHESWDKLLNLSPTWEYDEVSELYASQFKPSGAVPVVDKPDFEKMGRDYAEQFKTAECLEYVRADAATAMAKKVWNDHVVPLHDRVKELEEENKAFKHVNKVIKETYGPKPS